MWDLYIIIPIAYQFLLVKDHMKPVPIDEFGAHVQRMHVDRDRWFEMEYNVSGYTSCSSS